MEDAIGQVKRFNQQQQQTDGSGRVDWRLACGGPRQLIVEVVHGCGRTDHHSPPTHRRANAFERWVTIHEPRKLIAIWEHLDRVDIDSVQPWIALLESLSINRVLFNNCDRPIESPRNQPADIARACISLIEGIFPMIGLVKPTR